MPNAPYNPADLRKRVLDWGDTALRDLPWRRTRDPWAILVAESMLQQTQVGRVVERFETFLDRFPDPATMADSGVGVVVTEWQGLGYNRRAVQLHRAAVHLVAHHRGRVPDGLTELLAVPGVGPYTARAVRAFAFELPAAVLDTNTGRVLARCHGEPLRPRRAQELADELAEGAPPWQWNQSVMELGALVCSKRSPRCAACPVAAGCAWRGQGPDPAEGSAAVSVGQPPFAGSDRQLRGRLIDALRDAPVDRDRVAAVMVTDDAKRADRVVATLERDGLAVVLDGVLRLP